VLSVKFHDSMLMIMCAPDSDIELGLITSEPAESLQLSQQALSNSSGEYSEPFEPRQHLHQIIGDTLEVFSRHLR